MSEAITVNVGDEIPSFTRETGLANWNRYAAVNYEFVPIHMDDEAGKKAGYDTAFGMGALQWSYLHNLLREWLGDDARILKLGCQFRAPNLKGQTLTAKGIVTEVRGHEIDLEIWIEDQEGKKMAPGNATVAVG